MAGLGEAFTVLAVFEAVDRISGVLDKMDAGLDRFSETALKAAGAASEAGARIDESLLQTASGVDAMEVADARLSAAQDKLSATTARQAEAERALLDAQAQAAAAADGDATAQERLIAASDALAEAQKKTAKASSEVSAAQERQSTIQGILSGSIEEARAAAEAEAAAQARLAEQQRLAAEGSGLVSDAMKYGAIAVAAVGYESVKAAGNFESLTQHLVTDAGESQSSLAQVRAGMLALATQTGTSTTDIANGMYHVESAGYHLANGGLDVLKAAAEGAKVGGADLDTVSKALTGTMNAYNMSGSQATAMMNALIATVGQGDMKMQDLASSLGNVAPIAASAGISFAQVGAAIATMTAQNMSAQQATQDLAHTISSLQKPNSDQIKQMQAMGIDSNALSMNLGKVGLTGTLEQLTQAVAAHTQGGTVLISTFNASKQAAANANQMIKAMPGSLQSLATAYLNGSVTQKQWTADLQQLPPIQAAMMRQFAGAADQTQKFNQLLTSGSPAAETYNAAMSKLLGGQTGLKTALMLTGGRMQTFKDGTDAVSAALSKGGSTVDNWDKIQGTFNQKMDVAKASIEAAGISIGTALLPAVSAIAGDIAKVVGPMAVWISQHQKWVGLALSVAGAIGAVVAAMKAWEIVQGVMNALVAIFAVEETAILSPIELVVIAIAALVAGLVYAYYHFKTFHNVVDTVFSAVKGVIVGAWHVIETVWNALVAAAEWVGNAFATAFNAVAQVAKTVWGAISDVWNSIWSTTQTVWNAISGFFAKWWPLLLVVFAAPIAILVALWNHTHQALFDAAKSVWNAISGFFSTVWNVIVAAARIAWNLVKIMIILPIQGVWAWIQPAIHTVVSFLAGAWNSIVQAAQAAWSLVQHWIIQPLVDAWNWLNGWIGKFADIGSGIISGIISGIESGWNWLTKTIGNLANDALKAAKSFLGIGSPSREFAEQVGKWIPHGIASGIDQYAGVAHAAVGRLTTGLSTTAHTAITGSFTASTGGTGIPALAGAGSGATVVNNFDLRGAVVSDNAAMDRLATRVGNAITRQLPAAGIRTRAI